MLTEIAGQKLTREQVSYLDGFFAGLRNRGLRFADVAGTPAPAAPAVPAAPDLSELIPEERLKRELHPLDAFPLLLQHAAANQAPDKDNTFRFKWQGLFYLAPTKEGYMARLRIPGGLVTSVQLRELAAVANDLTTGYIQITTRSNLQMRMIQPKAAAEFLRRVQAVGLHTRGSGADNVRNLTCDATSGVAPGELLPTLPFVQTLAQLILNHREFYDLPRKFNIAFDGGGPIPTLEDTNDLGFTAVLAGQPESLRQPRHPGDVASAGIPPGVYFRVSAGGATGHKAFARDLGVLVKPEEAVGVAAAMLRAYLAHGNRGDRKKARLKHLLDTWSLGEFVAETERILGYSLLRAPAAVEPSADAAPPARTAHAHIGVYPQRQRGLSWIGAAAPVGQLTAKQMIRLAEIADLYGTGEVRLTVWQSIVIPNVHDAFVATAVKALERAGLETRPSHLKSGFVACTGNSYCKYAGANTKGHALELMKWLDRRVALDQPVNIHLTGCPNSCAQHYIGDIGLLGVKTKAGLEAYHVFVGGGFGAEKAVGRQLFHAVTVDELKVLLERVLKTYLARRAEGESFKSFTARHDVGRLQEMFSA